MRAFFRGLLFVVVALLAIPFATGFLLHLGSFEYFLAVISGVLLLTGILFLIRGRVSQGLLILALSIIVFLSSKDMIRMDGMNNIFYSSYYFGGAFIPSWLIIVAVILLIVLIVRRN
jgi:hypothetical protein